MWNIKYLYIYLGFGDRFVFWGIVNWVNLFLFVGLVFEEVFLEFFLVNKGGRWLCCVIVVWNDELVCLLFVIVDGFFGLFVIVV